MMNNEYMKINVQNERDILMAACGINAENPYEPKTQILIETKFLDLSTGEEELVGRVDLYGPVVNCFRNMQHMNLDVLFESSSDPDLIETAELLMNFSIPENSLVSGDNRVPVIMVTLLPLQLEGEYFAAGINASWVVMPSQMNNLPDTIRFIFNNNDFHTYRLNESELKIPDFEE